MGDSQRTRRLSRSRTGRTRAGRTSRAVPDRAQPRHDADAAGTAELTGVEQGDGVRRLAGVDTEQTEELDVVDPAADPDAADPDTADRDAGADDDAVAEDATAGPGDADAPDVTVKRAGESETAVATAATGAHARKADTPASEPAAGDAPGPGDVTRTGAAGTAAADDLPVRPPRSRRVGRRRAVGPVLGDQLARELLGIHRQDVLLSDRCSCGEPFPCRARAFATCFVLDKAYPPADLEMPYRIVPPELRAQAGPRHAAPALGAVTTSSLSPETAVSGGSTEGRAGTPVADRSGTGDGRSQAASHLPVDLDATVQFAKVPAAPVAVAS